MSNQKTISDIKIGEDRAIHFKFKGRGSTISAKYLEIECDEQGRLKGILLDRVIHSEDEHTWILDSPDYASNTLSLSGCYCTQINFSISA